MFIDVPSSIVDQLVDVFKVVGVGAGHETPDPLKRGFPTPVLASVIPIPDDCLRFIK